MRAAGANTEKKVEKKPNVAAQKACMCGCGKFGTMPLNMTEKSTVDLCSSSTGTGKRRPKTSFVPFEFMPLPSSVSWSVATSALRSSYSRLTMITQDPP